MSTTDELTSEASGSNTAASPSLAAVSIKLPPYWPTDPTVWFLQVEAQFSTRGITSQKTMFDYVVASLSPDIAFEIRDLLIRPPTDNPYNTLRAELVKRTAASEQKKLQQLISGEELGDRKPTQLLRRMQQLLGDHLGATAENNAFLKELFLQRLPANVRIVLASADDATDLQKLADMADKIVEVATPTVAAVTDTSTEVQQLKEEVSRLADLVASLSQRDHLPRRSRSTSRHRRPHTPARTDSRAEAQDLCWYHSKFGEAARKCQEPCSWGNSTAGH